MKKTIIYLFAMVFIYSCTPQDAPNTFTDSRDGKVYKTVTIGDQVWMAEDLAYLPSVVGPATVSDTEPYYYVYGYYGTDVVAAKAIGNFITYGALYNWPAAMNGDPSSGANPIGVQGICPEGWHLPSYFEWITLIDYLGGEDVAGGKLKETGTAHWEDPNFGATNESGFTALPGGYPYNDAFSDIGRYGNWWGSSEYDVDNAMYLGIRSGSSPVDNGSDSKELGMSVRCLRD
ncbi:MAG: FISUMP domain-containing protein [Bacteroidales bacterium]|nr:FISUMP domain-containing protein [Bacteroidales bacterium]